MLVVGVLQFMVLSIPAISEFGLVMLTVTTISSVAEHPFIPVTVSV